MKVLKPQTLLERTKCAPTTVKSSLVVTYTDQRFHIYKSDKNRHANMSLSTYDHIINCDINV